MRNSLPIDTLSFQCFFCLPMKKQRLDLSDSAAAPPAPPPPTGSGVNAFTGRAYSERYHSILAKRVQLPVYLQRDDFINMLHTHQTIVLVGETGSGKTTQVRPRLAPQGPAPTLGRRDRACRLPP